MQRIFLCLDFKAALSPFPYQEDADEGGYEEDGGDSHKQPLKRVECDAHDGGFRGAVIPVQVWAVEQDQGCAEEHEDRAQGDEQPKERFSLRGLSLCELCIDALRFWGERLEVAGVALRPPRPAAC